MEYYCNVCEAGITKAEFLYSIDHFDRALCRQHQKLERSKQRPQPVAVAPSVVEPAPRLHVDHTPEASEDPTPKKKRGRLMGGLRKIGGGLKKGAKSVSSGIGKQRQVGHWKEAILRRMTFQQVKQFCFEKKKSIKKTVMKTRRDGSIYTKEIAATHKDLVKRIKHWVRLDDILAFAKRRGVRIQDINAEMDAKQRERDAKTISDAPEESGGVLLLEVTQAIREFKPFRRYDHEVPYQDSLAAWLKSKFPSTKIEVARGSTRPDIVVEGVAIEVKGPTFAKDLQTIADKCMRYIQYFTHGLICVLFDVDVTQRYYSDWKRGMNTQFPNVKIIPIQA